MKKVNVVLPAYNGEKYIGAQIESLLGQSYPNIDIYIRDDKSSDRTVEVVRAYMGREPEGKRIILIESEGVNWGYVRNVFDTWKLTGPADYYCFCDQDDVWHPDKVEKCVALLERQGAEKPALCFTGFNYCDSTLHFTRKSDSVPEGLCLRHVCYDFPVLNFNITVNHAFREMFFANLPADGSYPHYPDSWMAKAAAAQGRLYHVDEPLVEYRRNDQAASYANHSALALFVWRVKRFLFGEEIALVRKELTDFRQACADFLGEDDRRMLDVFTGRGAGNGLRRLFYPARLRRRWTDELGLRLMFLIGRL